MENPIYDKIKTAAEKAESREFPAMEKVWGRVEEKLDNTVLKKQKNIWKYLAVAASLLLLVSLGFQFFLSDKNDINNKNGIAVGDSVLQPQTQSPEEIVITPSSNKIIKAEAPQILKEQIEQQQQIAVAEKPVPSPAAEAIPNQGNLKESAVAGTNNEEVSKAADKSASVELMLNKKAGKSPRNNEPLVIIDGEAAKAEKSSGAIKSYSTSSEVDEVVELTEPLYIINGVEYTEEQLFGEHPTSPYAPLSAQDIESTKVLQGAEATAAYGAKGNKGVVIITTKNRKPAKPKPGE
ncbi:MAG TPA: hypothetical protein VGB50_02135 [Flavobacterium sp.]|jgi:TonB-dependent SusC/RagA subfamily outer membrane receptor